MKYEFNGKKINIPDSEIKYSIDKYNLTEKEAIQMWLEDEGYLENEEQEELEKKAKENRITATIHQATTTQKKKTQKERVRKNDTTKEMIISKLAETLETLAEEVKIANAGKIITFKFGEDNYKLDLIRQRKLKNK